jgi:antitoxin (DNA-binding transcriptional repressor) of toxin-antitoxin stability system
MSTHTVADAQSHLPSLIERALAGESVVIERDVQPAVELRAVAKAPPVSRAGTKADLAWLDAHRVGKRGPEDSGTTTSRMRDEDWR